MADDRRHLAVERPDAFKRLPKIAQPNKTFYTHGELAAGGKPFEYGHIPRCRAHRRRYVRVLPAAERARGGRRVSGQGWPSSTGGPAAGSAASSAASQRLQTLANAETRIVPGARAGARAGRSQDQYEMYSTIYDRLAQLLNKGRGPDEAVAAKPTKEFDAQMGNPDEFVRRAFESLWAYLSPGRVSHECIEADGRTGEQQMADACASSRDRFDARVSRAALRRRSGCAAASG